MTKQTAQEVPSFKLGPGGLVPAVAADPREQAIPGGALEETVDSLIVVL